MSQEKKTLATTKTDVQTDENYDYIIDAPLFIKFAEYLGFVSSLVSWCDELCEGRDIAEYKKKFIEVEAKTMFNEMLKSMTREEIKDYFETFYEVILYVWDDNLQELKQKSMNKK
jgi:hypothetical protein